MREMIAKSGSLRPGDFQRVVAAFYEAAAAPELLRSALSAFGAATGSTGVSLHIVGNPDPRSINNPEFDEYFVDYIQQRLWANPRMIRSMELIQRGFKGFLTDHDIYPTEEDRNVPFEKDFLEPRGFSPTAGMVIAQHGDIAVPFVFDRKISDGSFQQSDIRAMNKFAKHLESAGALLVRNTLANGQNLADTLGRRGEAFAVIALDGRLLSINAEFERLIGHGIVVRRNRIGAAEPRADRAIEIAVDTICRPLDIERSPPQPIIIPRASSGLRPLVMQVVPLYGASQDIFYLARGLVFVTDLERMPALPAIATLREAFSLTTGEAELAARIASGKTLNEIAEDMKLSYETVRSRIKPIFAKTDTSRQSELALLLAQLARLF